MVLVCLLPPFATEASPDGERETLVAALLLRFASYTQWERIDPADETFTICLPDDFPEQSRKLLEIEKVRGRPVTVVTYREPTQIRGHLVMLDGTDPVANDLPNLVQSGSSILIVGLDSGFWDAGGVIRLYFEEEKPMFEVHLGNAERCGVKISARMLQLATRIIR
jgi:hypothetical protein